MSKASNKMIDDFISKPKTKKYFEIIEDYLISPGECKKEIKVQTSFSENRKFL